MGNLALAMGPAALAAGLLVGALGMAAGKAMQFESAMADVAKVVNFETAAELREMNTTATFFLHREQSVGCMVFLHYPLG